MKNSEISYAQEYHQTTKHSEITLRTSGHYLDWQNRPSQFKTYEGLPSTPLPRDFPKPESDALSSISGQEPAPSRLPVGISELAELLFYSAGLTRKMRHGSEIHYLRAASATGALYPIELYVVSGEMPGLKAGVYHFNPLEFELVQLRDADYRADLGAASDQGVESAPFTVVFTSLAWKNAWKYEARSYRHWFWDGGVIAANFLAVSSAMKVPTKIIVGFVDSEVNDLLGLKGAKEATVLLAPVGPGQSSRKTHASRKIGRIEPRVRPISKDEVEYAEIWRINQSSSLTSRDETTAWTAKNAPRRVAPQPSGPVFKLDPEKPVESPRAKLGDVILQRGSTRRFARSPIKLSQLSTILRASTGKLPVDYSRTKENLVDIYFTANAVDGLQPGSYFYNREEELLEQLKTGQMRHMSAYLSLEQGLFSEASATLFIMTRLDEVLATFGNRGYRVAQLEGGIVAGKIYLAAYSLGLGASGSTFYDDAVTEFFSPHAKEKSAVIEVGLGVPAYKAKPGRILPQFS
jgi:SagB-type dehydrogenase family enzyme